MPRTVVYRNVARAPERLLGYDVEPALGIKSQDPGGQVGPGGLQFSPPAQSMTRGPLCRVASTGCVDGVDRCDVIPSEWRR